MNQYNMLLNKTEGTECKKLFHFRLYEDVAEMLNKPQLLDVTWCLLVRSCRSVSRPCPNVHCSLGVKRRSKTDRSPTRAASNFTGTRSTHKQTHRCAWTEQPTETLRQPSADTRVQVSMCPLGPGTHNCLYLLVPSDAYTDTCTALMLAFEVLWSCGVNPCYQAGSHFPHTNLKPAPAVH